MAMRYDWSWDVSQISSGLSMQVTEDGVGGGTYTIDITSGIYSHVAMSQVGATSLPEYLSALMTALSLAGNVYVVTYMGGSYSFLPDGIIEPFSLTLAGSTARTNMAQILGFSGSTGLALSHTSDIRPYYTILPAIEARSMMTDEYEPEGMVFEAVTDGGDAFQVSKGSDEVWSDWMQVAETDVAPSVATEPGTPVFERQATAEVPWTYQHAWRHHRTGAHPFLVTDGSEQAIHVLRGEGSSLKPTRFATQDYPLWSVSFKTRLLGRL